MNTKQNSLKIKVNHLLCSFIIISTLLLLSVTSAFSQGDADRQKRSKVIAMYNDYTGNFPEIEDIASEEALQLLARSNTVFVDVRKPKEQKISMIPGAVTKEQFLKRIKEYRDKKVIAYCTIGYRSGKFAEKMAKKGFDVMNLRAGLLGWVHAHGPLVSKDGPVHTLNVYGKTWDLAPSWITTVY